MSNEGFRNVPGVPDGWELVRVGRPVVGDFVVHTDGRVLEHGKDSCVRMNENYPILRKIEQPAKYRPFESSEEFLPYADRKISRVGNDGKKIPGFTIATSCSDSGVWLGDLYSDWKSMLHRGHVFLDDGTPFGVKVEE